MQQTHSKERSPERTRVQIAVLKPPKLSSLKISIEKTPLTVASKPSGLGRITHKIEDFADSYNGVFSGLVWMARDVIANTAFEIFGVKPKNAYRVQTGIPLEDMKITSDDIRKLSALFSYEDKSFKDLLQSFSEAIPQVHSGTDVKESGMYFHIKKGFTTSWVQSKEDRDIKDVFDVIRQAERDDFKIILRGRVTQNTNIRRHLNRQISALRADIGNEMIITLREFFPDNYTQMRVEEKIKFLESRIKFIQRGETYRKPNQEDFNYIGRATKFRYGALEILHEAVKTVDTINDPDELNNLKKGLKSKIYNLAVSTGIIDQQVYPFHVSEVVPKIRFAGLRFLNNSHDNYNVGYYICIAKELKNNLSSGKINLDFLKNINLDDGYEIIVQSRIANSEKNPVSFKVLFRQAQVEIPAILDVDYVRNGHPDTYYEKFSFRPEN